MKCPNCGTVNPADEDFCSNCGFYLKAAPAPTSNSGTFSTATTTTGATTVGGNSRTLAPNTRLEGGRYVVEKILGEGGMGAAVLARDTRVSNKVVVIKELISDNTDPTKHQEDVNNFEREVATLATIDHPLVPTVTDSFQEGSRYFMVQEYAAGENLEQHMERINKPMPEAEALTYISQVLDILDYLSQQTPPIVHRDIKPANIIIGTKDHRARLVDFGIARADVARNAKRKQTSALGTPGYAPPEQYQGNADARSDLYGLAATLHHLLTNRDPRNYPPFSYPTVRSLNSQVSNDTERLLNKALMIDVTKRYQNAADMKRDVDQILADDFGTTGDTSTYILGTSGPMTAPRRVPQQAPVAAVPAGGRNVPPPPAPPSIPPRQPVPQQAQAGTYAQQPRPRKSNNGLIRNFILLILVLALIGTVIVFNLPKASPGTINTGPGSAGPTATTGGNAGTLTISKSGEGTITANGQLIGLSAGSYAFDTNRNHGTQKQQASTKLLGGDLSSATSLWNSYLTQDTSDAESLIYLENQRVVQSGAMHVTLAVGTMLTGDSGDIQVGRDSLQGAYIAQREFNDNASQHNGVKLRLLIANSGGNAQAATTVANGIISAQKQDHTVIGVMGWPYSGLAQNALAVLSQAKIPMVSQTASSTQLTGISQYFFRVAPSDKSQGAVAAQYAKDVLGAKNVAVFQDPGDSYSSSLAAGFSSPFQTAGGTVIAENYTRGDANSIQQAMQTALKQVPAPDLIYFAGYSVDVNSVLGAIPDSSQIKVLGGDALYNLAGYKGRNGLSRLRFTAFAYPDEWGVLGDSSRQPVFFQDYKTTYDPNNQHSNVYGFQRPSYNVMLSYDATLTMLTAVSNALKGGKTTLTFTGSDLQQGLSQIQGANSVQGVSGQISFPNGGDPDQKAVLIIMVSDQGYFQMQPKLGAGKFLVS